MLRQPSAYRSVPRGEGCSSTAIARPRPAGFQVWGNLAGRGSWNPAGRGRAAVPWAFRAPGREV